IPAVSPLIPPPMITIAGRTLLALAFPPEHGRRGTRPAGRRLTEEVRRWERRGNGEQRVRRGRWFRGPDPARGRLASAVPARPGGQPRLLPSGPASAARRAAGGLLGRGAGRPGRLHRRDRRSQPRAAAARRQRRAPGDGPARTAVLRPGP